ncbi:Ig-like domain-containing protein [Pendulispora brunnea]|uniref:Ig-like domain-containing protein n=1 Tax=Pendulispora brunnea TaxID=2905690 RepID=A0ABZ2KHC7_9BACT
MADKPDADKPDAEEPDGAIPDELGPQILSSWPINGGENTVGGPIQVKFTEPVKLGATATQLLVDGTPVAATTKLSEDGTVLDIVPIADILPPAKVSVRFGDISDLHGNPRIDEPFTWTVPRWFHAGSLPRPEDTTFRVASGPGDAIFLSRFTATGPDGVELTVFKVGRNDFGFEALPVTVRFNLVTGFPTSQFPEVRIDNSGAPVVAIYDHEDKIHVLRWSGAQWKDLAPPMMAGERNSRALIAIAPGDSGKITLAYEVRGTGPSPKSGIRVQEYDGGRWLALGPLLEQSTMAMPLKALVFDEQGIPTMAWEKLFDGATTMTWNGTGWIASSPVVSSDLVTKDMSIAWGDGHSLFSVVGLSQGIETGPYRNRVLRLDAPLGTWNEVGAALPDVPLGRPVTLLPAGAGHLFASFATQATDAIPAKFWALDITKTGWSEMTGLEIPPGWTESAGAAVDGRGVPIVAVTTKDEVRVLRLNRK